MPIGTGSVRTTDGKRQAMLGRAPLLLAILVAILILGMTWLALRFLWNYAVDDVTDDRLAAMDRNSFLIEARLRGRANDMFFLKRVAEAELAHNPTAAVTSDNFRNAVTTMMLARSQYDEIRLLDLQGEEIFRYNWKGGAHPLEEVTDVNLQNKSNRPFYKETLMAGSDAAVFSPLDLNIDHNQIEKPYKPVVRISGQIVGPDGQPRALLVLNYLGDQLLREVKQDTNKQHQSMLLNADGYWLVGPNSDSQWGFMFPEKNGINLKEENPELWNKIKAHTSGWISEGGSIYCFQNIDPIGSTTDYPPLRMSVLGGERLKWTLLTKVSDDAVWKTVSGIRHGIWATCAALLAVLVPLVWYGGTSLERRRQDVREVREARTMLDSVIETSPNGVTVMEAIRDEQNRIIDLKLVMSNKMAITLMGRELPAGPQEGRSMLKDYPESRQSGSYDAFCSAIETGKPVVHEELYTQRGMRKWLSFRAAKREDGVVVTLVDITESKNALHREQELRLQAQAAEQAKSEFLAVMSHEIRTPMNGVIGMTSILADTEMTEEQRDCVNTIHSSGEALLTVINDILDFSKIESGKMTLESKPFDLRQCVEETLDLFAVQIRKKGLEAGYLIGAEVPTQLIGDSNRLRQILINLIGNAVKFTERGEITLNIQQQSRDEKGCHLLLSIKDTGIGISQEGIAKLFQSFQQVDSSTTRRYGGTGLGLVISRRLAELMKGRMWVESQVGAGSIFFFNVVLEAAPIQGSVGGAEPVTLTEGSVLIVDDNDTNRHILETQLKAWGMTTTSASSGREALKKINASRFDVILLDLQMPEMDGITLAREIRKDVQSPLILLSSAGNVEVGEAGSLFRYQIPKPIKQSLLFDALLEVAGRSVPSIRKSVNRKFDPGMASRQPLRILLAEDNSVNQKVGLLMLSNLGYRADIADNGHQVLDAVEKVDYDLIFMDVQMPEMDGIEATRQLKEKLGAKCPVIVALTANALEGDREKFLSMGFDDYLSKPLSPDRLRGALEKVSERRAS